VIEVRRLHHCALRTGDLDEAVERWSRLWSLTPVGSDGRAALLRCADEDYGLELIEGGAPGHDHTAYELARGLTLDDAVLHLETHGVACTIVEGPCGTRAGVRFADPAGYGVELVEHVPPEDARPYEARTGGGVPAHHPRKVGHVNVLVDDVAGAVRFYVDVLGFRVSDWIGDGACWLHVGHDHHVWAALAKSPPHFHHLAFEMVDFDAMRVSLDHVAQWERWVTWGPGRHAMARNLFAYVRMPEEACFVELYCDMELLPPDHEPRQWPDDVHSSNAWGTLPPRTYFRFDDEAVRLEREQLVNLGREFVPA